jgi:hypothetical protein
MQEDLVVAYSGPKAVGRGAELAEVDVAEGEPEAALG